VEETQLPTSSMLARHVCTSLHWGMASKPGGSGMLRFVMYRANDVCLFLSSIHSMYMYIGMSVVISCAKHSTNTETYM
jgi:hypothetical protein